MASHSEQDFFHDCPWLNIPPHRQAIIIEEPQLPKGRLLGGSGKDGKMSKLAALAAKRRKEKEALKSSSDDTATESNDYTERLRQLHVTQPRRPERSAETDNDQKAKLQAVKDEERRENVDNSPQIQHDLPEPGFVQHLRQPPSAFASVLTQPGGTAATNNDILQPADDVLARSPFDFSQPSPDDVFRRAQGSK